jgi:ATP-binding cassette subfamily C exporter for protease/lipase
MMKIPSFFQRSELAAAVWAFRAEFGAVALFSLVTNLLMLMPTIYMLQIYDRVLMSQSGLTLLAISLITLFLFGLMAFSDWSRSRVLVRAGVRFDQMLGTRVFNASFESHLGQGQGSPGRAFVDLLQIRQFLTGNGIFAFFDAPWAPIYIAVAFFLHPLLGVTALLFAGIQGLLAWFGHRRTVAPSEAAMKANNDVNAYVQGKLRNAEVIEAMGMLGNLKRRWAMWQQVYILREGDSQAIAHRVVALSKFVRYTQQAASLAVGALLVVHGELTTGGMIAANLLIARALAPIDQIVGTWRQAIGAWSAFQRLEQLLATNPERDPNLSRVAPGGSLQLRDVVATAPRRQEPILKGVSLVIEPGTVNVVLGPSGSGKSTLARVMMGIWPDVQGEVLLDGLPLQGWDRVELGPHLGYLPQDVELFEGTIADNIARFSEVDAIKVIDAARAAGLHEMILRFPKGYDTPMGEAGGLLSGGQRQRIGVARAVYGNPTLVVLDEPNANLDDAGEAALVRTVADLKAAGKTVVLITHRPGIVGIADRIVVLRDGRIVFDGPRESVLASLRAAQAAAAQGRALPPSALQPA